VHSYLKTLFVATAIALPLQVDAQDPVALRTWCFSSATEQCFTLYEFDFIVNGVGLSETWDVNIVGKWYGSGFPLAEDSFMALVLPVQTTAGVKNWWFPEWPGAVPAEGGEISQTVVGFSAADGYGDPLNIIEAPTIDQFIFMKLEATGICIPDSTSPTNSELVQDYGACFTVTPEPSTYVLLATGLGVLGLVARRRRSEDIVQDEA
jgi:PEP-CTERM motif